jgi:hypothetical protein
MGHQGPVTTGLRSAAYRNQVDNPRNVFFVIRITADRLIAG